VKLLSRYAESLLWLARYIERAASLARVVEMQSSFGRAGEGPDGSWGWLLKLYSDEERFAQRHATASSTNIIDFYVLDSENAGSIRSCIHWARENARALRAFAPTEMWVQISELHSLVQELDADHVAFARLPRTCSQVRSGCHAQIGVAESTIYRDEGYCFFKLGLMIERADQTSRLLDVKFAQRQVGIGAGDAADDFVFWSSILRTAGSYQVFRRLEPSGADAERVARFLIYDARAPRSLRHCVREIGELLHELRRSFHLTRTNACLERYELLLEGVEVAGADPEVTRRLHDFNDWVQRMLCELTADIGEAFLGQSRTPAVQAPAISQSQSQS